MTAAACAQAGAALSVRTDDAARARALVEDLHRADPRIYWCDLLASAALGWGGFAWAVAAPWDSWGALAGALLAVAGLYRGLSFIHELSHLPAGALPGFGAVWEMLYGVPLLMPSFTYVGVHQYHHAPATFGTAEDPEYLPFARSRRMTFAFVAHSVLIPLALLARFFVLNPPGLCVPALHRWLAAHASSLSMNPKFVRIVTPALEARIRRGELAILGLGIALGLAVVLEALPARVGLVWYGAAAAIALVNTLRTLAAHRYESAGEPLDRAGQLADSIDTPGACWTELWAPVGLRYHALHHYFPGLPYHNLPAAHRRLLATLPQCAAYRQVQSPSLLHSLCALLARPSARTETRRKAFEGT